MSQELPYVDFPTAKLLKEKGFDWEVCDYFHYNLEWTLCESSDCEPDNYNTEDWGEKWFSRPTVALAIMWLREVKGLHIFCNIFVGNIHWAYIINDLKVKWCENQLISVSNFETQALAESAALIHALKLI